MTIHPISLRGAFPPIPTPFNAQGEIDYAALRRNFERWNSYNLAGYLVLGSNGEPVYLTEEEKRRVLEVSRELIPADKVMIAGTGYESTRETIAATRRAAEIGADAALIVTPHYYGSEMRPENLVRHYHEVAEASPIPVILYNVPKFTNVDMDTGTIVRAGQHPNVIGAKDSSGNITKIGDVIRLAKPGFQVLAGSAGFLFPTLTLGGVGGVMALANVAPQECIDICRLFQEGKWDEAAALQRRMIPVNAAVTARWAIPGLKAALDMLGYYGGPVRRPLLDLPETEKQTLKGVLVEGGVLKP